VRVRLLAGRIGFESLEPEELDACSKQFGETR
jgi:hypothetical protein